MEETSASFEARSAPPSYPTDVRGAPVSLKACAPVGHGFSRAFQFGMEETSASFEARYVPPSYPTDVRRPPGIAQSIWSRQSSVRHGSSRASNLTSRPVEWDPLAPVTRSSPRPQPPQGALRSLTTSAVGPRAVRSRRPGGLRSRLGWPLPLRGALPQELRSPPIWAHGSISRSRSAESRPHSRDWGQDPGARSRTALRRGWSAAPCPRCFHGRKRTLRPLGKARRSVWPPRDSFGPPLNHG